MLPREEAHERLKSLEIPDWEQRREDRLDGLPGRLRHAARSVFPDFREHPFDPTKERPRPETLAALAPQQRVRVFEAAAPGQGETLERTWQLFDRLPYQHDYLRRPFRVPGRPELSLERRADYLGRVSLPLARFSQPVSWFASWSVYLTHYADLGYVFAAEIDGGVDGDEVFSTLVDIVGGRHPIGGVSRDVIRGLLSASREEGWDAVANLLAAAQRQEGIRSTIFETVDECHPGALRRFVRTAVDENLTRFAALVRAFDVWFGLGLDVTDRKRIDVLLARVADALDSADAARSMIASDDPEQAYCGLWAWAVSDAAGAVVAARSLLTADSVAQRFATTHFLSQVRLPESGDALLELLSDADPRVAWHAFQGLSGWGQTFGTDPYPALENYLMSMGQDRRLEPPIWDWIDLQMSRAAVVRSLLGHLGRRHPMEVYGHLADMDADGRGRFARLLAEARDVPGRREALIALLADRSQWVAKPAFEALGRLRLAPEEAPAVEDLLRRQSGPTRAGAVALLLTLGDRGVAASVDRLLGSGNKPQRLGGIDLARQLIEADRSPGRWKQKLRHHLGEARDQDEQSLIRAVFRLDEDEPTLEDGLGLFDPRNLSPSVAPTSRKAVLTTKGSQKLLAAADAVAEAFREEPVSVQRWDGRHEELYGNLRRPPLPESGVSYDAALLYEVWSEWWARQVPGPLDLARALAQISITPGHFGGWISLHGREAKKAMAPPAEVDRPAQVGAALWWLWYQHGTADSFDLWLDAAESALAMVPQKQRRNPIVTIASRQSWQVEVNVDWRTHSPLVRWVDFVGQAARLRPDLWDRRHAERLWRLLCWLDRPSPGAIRLRAELDDLAAARRAGLASDADVVDHLIGPRPDLQAAGVHWSPRHTGYHSLAHLTRLRPLTVYAETPGLLELAGRVRDRVLEIELGRGDLPTLVSEGATNIRSVPGAAIVVQLVAGLGRARLVRGWSYGNTYNKANVFSKLIRAGVPAASDTPDGFARLAQQYGLNERRLLELAMFAPQWSRFVEHAVDWPGLEDAVYWVHAHTKDARWQVDADVREIWVAQTAERTPLTADELTDGAVDVAWFARASQRLGPARWDELAKHVKYAAGGSGHKRAEIFAQALSGSLEVEALVARIRSKRHQDSVRALGLLPLPEDEADRRAVILERYQILQQFVSGSKKFGSQRQASERRAVEIGMDNLARTAGYADPQRLGWAMEIEETADLANGPVVVEKDDYRFQLAIDDQGVAEFQVTRGQRTLKSVPVEYRKHEDVQTLRDRARLLRKQTSRVRASLEASSVRGDLFEAHELQQLSRHPILGPMLAATLFTDGDSLLGYPATGGRELRTWDGTRIPVGSGRLRPVHPTDLLAAGAWREWQRECLAARRVQPFKQIFRELYVPTATELGDERRSTRYAGQQVNPRQALALFGARGWVTNPEMGPVKTFHAENLIAWVDFEGGWFTPAEVDGLTIGTVQFVRRGEWDAVSVVDVPARLFSEVMRDVDLVVSVAHMGGVDPEASASTVEMRLALVREMAILLEMDNIRFANSHAMVDGRLGTYSVHLGSGVVHRQPGGAVCIIPVGSQHRGRLFLPFADDDPKTAEVISKVMMLSKDDEIRDPTILEQLVR